MHVTHAYTYPIHWFSSQQSTLDLENSFIYFRHCRRLTWSMISLNLPTPWRSWIVLKPQMKNYRTILGNGAKSNTMKKTKHPIKCWITSQKQRTVCIQFNHLRFSGYFDMFFYCCFLKQFVRNFVHIFILSFGWPLSIVVSSTVFCVFCGASKYHRARFRVWCTFKPWKKNTTLNCAH